MTKRILSSIGAFALTGLVSACMGPDLPPYPLPDDPGLYAVTRDNDLLRLDGDREWEVESWPQRAALSSYTEFVIFDPALERDGAVERPPVDIWRVAWLRSEVDAQGYAGPIQGSEWVVAPIEGFEVPTTVKFVPGFPGYVHAVPNTPLEPGLYSLRLAKHGTGTVSRFGVDWQNVDKRRYAARNCVDRYPGSELRFHVCGSGGAARQQASTEGLEVTLVDPLRRDTTLVVQGIVTNTAQQPKRLPGMQATLLDASGSALSRAPIEPLKSELSAGEHTRFKAEFPNAPEATARIDIEFVPTTSAGM